MRFLGLKRGFLDYKVAPRPQKRRILTKKCQKQTKKHSRLLMMGDFAAVISVISHSMCPLNDPEYFFLGLRGPNTSKVAQKTMFCSGRCGDSTAVTLVTNNSIFNSPPPVTMQQVGVVFFRLQHVEACCRTFAGRALRHSRAVGGGPY